MPKAEGSKIVSALKLIFLLCFLLLCWYRCFEMGATSLADPDSCWLIAVGRWISAHNALPQSDPFSWTLQNQHNNYLPYQWLSSLIFYSLYKACGASSLLYFVSLSVMLSFVVIPFYLARKLRVSLFAQSVISATAMAASSFHFFLRPEIFSYFFLSLLLFYVTGMLEPQPISPSLDSNSTAHSRQLFHNSVLLPPVCGFLLFMTWANLHSGFVVGFLILLAALIGIMSAPTGQGNLRRVLCFFSAGIIGSLCTPFGLRLYAYLPHLFFSPINKVNQELMPLKVYELLSVNYGPFTLIQLEFAASLIFLYLTLRRNRNGAQQYFNSSLIAPLICFSLLTIVAFIAGDLCRRMIPLAVLISYPYFMVSIQSCAKTLKLEQFKTMDIRQFLLIIATTLVSAAQGTAAAISLFSVSIPQTIPSFYVPDQAVQFIKEKRPHGHLLNDPQCGDVLIFSLQEDARVFIDTRFDLYGTKIFWAYLIMANALNGYENLLREYQIDWVFFPPRAPLLSKLSKNPEWQTIYRDDAAVIMVRQKADAR